MYPVFPSVAPPLSLANCWTAHRRIPCVEHNELGAARSPLQHPPAQTLGAYPPGTELALDHYQRTLNAATPVNPTRNNTPTSAICNNTHLLVGVTQPLGSSSSSRVTSAPFALAFSDVRKILVPQTLVTPLYLTPTPFRIQDAPALHAPLPADRCPSNPRKDARATLSRTRPLKGLDASAARAWRQRLANVNRESRAPFVAGSDAQDMPCAASVDVWLHSHSRARATREPLRRLDDVALCSVRVVAELAHESTCVGARHAIADSRQTRLGPTCAHALRELFPTCAPHARFQLSSPEHAAAHASWPTRPSAQESAASRATARSGLPPRLTLDRMPVKVRALRRTRATPAHTTVDHRETPVESENSLIRKEGFSQRNMSSDTGCGRGRLTGVAVRISRSPPHRRHVHVHPLSPPPVSIGNPLWPGADSALSATDKRCDVDERRDADMPRNTSLSGRTLLPLLTRDPEELPLESADSGRRLEFVLAQRAMSTLRRFELTVALWAGAVTNTGSPMLDAVLAFPPLRPIVGALGSPSPRMLCLRCTGDMPSAPTSKPFPELLGEPCPEFEVDAAPGAQAASASLTSGAKDGKAQQYAVLAKHIFECDPHEQARYANDKAKYTTAVETRLRRLKKEYKGILEQVGATGAGLDPERVREGSQLASVFGESSQSLPTIYQSLLTWGCIRRDPREVAVVDELHAFWRELPNYNPIGVQSSEPGTDHANAALALFDDRPGGSDDEDGRSDTSRARDGIVDDGGDDKSHSSSPDDDDDDDDDDIDVHSAPTPTRSLSGLSRNPTPPPSVPAAPSTRKSSKTKAKSTAAATGRDLGLAKANAANSSGNVKKKPQTAIDRLNDLRETESIRLAEKRQLQHEEEMERIKVKKMKYELKMLQAQNERARLNRRAMSQSPLRRERVLNIRVFHN
ncbi:hypothetical protein B0H10DRAFT_2229112 [Mycena sp. CBHHK59/15]|nr:hypothetical protein B0H10DRAFT_2229112 [Mycena sp. CBHHK59/15]